MTDLWTPSTDYALAALVIPRASATVVQQALTNPGFESGDSGWTKGTGWTISSGSAYAGSWKAARSNTAGTSLLKNNNIVPVAPGQSLTVSVALRTVGSGAEARVGVRWLTSGDVEIQIDYGTLQDTSSTEWKTNTVTASAPATAAKAQLVVEGTCAGGLFDSIGVDAAAWDYAYVSVPSALFYEATVAGASSTVEPTWPTTAGLTVVDGGVTWTARAAISITWEAKPILKSDATEPTWPLVPGGLVADNTISWQTSARRIEDTNCPNTRAVVKLVSKIFAADDDIVRFCATVNCKDWTSAEDAGYLASGLNQDGNNETSVLNVYRGNLVVMSASTFQMWGVDEDPASNALIDKKNGIGSIYHRAASQIGDDLYILCAQGVRSVGLSVGSDNQQAGDVGMPVDSLIQAALARSISAGYDPRGFYYPGAGQYWLSFAGVTVEKTDAWASVTMPAGEYDWYRVAYGNGLWVALAADVGPDFTGTDQIATSADATNWTLRTLPASEYWVDVIWSGSYFYAVSSSGTFARSSTGTTWTDHGTISLPLPWRLAVKGSTIVCLSSSETGSDDVAVSTDGGATWTNHDVGVSSSRSDIAANGSVFVIARGSAPHDSVLTSPDGVTWTERTLPSSANWYSVGWNGSTFLLIANSSDKCATSPDGITWTPGTMPASANWIDMAWDGSRWCAIANGYDLSAVSTDGLTWETVLLPLTSGWHGIAGNDSEFLAVGVSEDSAGAILDVRPEETSEVFVYTMNKLGSVGAWSRYLLPYRIDAFAQLGDDLYLRDGQAVRKVTEGVNYDWMPNGSLDGEQRYYDGIVWWPWLDCGQPGMDKMMEGFDIIGTGAPSVQIGYDQRDVNAFTDAYEIDEDTLSDGMIAMPLTAPTFSLKITYPGGEGNFWQLNSAILYFDK